MGQRTIVAACVSAGLVSGCVQAPKYSQTYHQPQAKTRLTVTGAVACNEAGNDVFSGFALSDVTKYVPTPKVYTVNFAKLSGPLSSDDTTLGLTRDGLLTSVDSTATGQGEQYVKTAISLVSSLALLGVLGESPPIPAFQKPSVCDTIRKIGKKKPVSVTYIPASNAYTPIKYALEPRTFSFPLKIDTTQSPLPVSVVKALPKLWANVSIDEAFYKEVPKENNYEEKYKGQVYVVLPYVVPYHVKIYGKYESQGEVNKKLLLSDTIQVPLKKPLYAVPIPMSRSFGSDGIHLKLYKSGAIQSIAYNPTQGASQALASGSDIAAGIAAYPSKKAAYLKAKNDILAQVARAVQCKAKPDQCQ